MRVHMYKQVSNVLKEGTISYGSYYDKLICEDCNGTGIFHLYEDSWKCNDCKGSGFHWVSLL